MRSPTRARLTFAALTWGAPLTLAACGTSTDTPPLSGGTASPSGSASTSPSPSASTSPSITPTASATPAPSPTKSDGKTVTKGGVATGKGADAARTVAQAFIAADNVSTKTGSFTARDKLTASSCTWCADKRAFVAKIYNAGGHIDGELFTKNTFTVTAPSTGVYTVVVDTTVSRYKEINGAGKVTDSHADRTGLLTLQVGGSKVAAASWQPGS